ncbi:hypothetical protein HaLaN_00919 [Haematococcus lacustris]|uniref:Uncharacterized protein n=1 Tax=Haematococcus lacustris TaxID=44745 RepID=A0A699Y808_HAELA|nr:hypothetical protein HaLaN_00919 [Haematococcus lacustris]
MVGATSEHITAVILRVIDPLSLDVGKFVAFCSVGASTFMGAHNGVMGAHNGVTGAHNGGKRERKKSMSESMSQVMKWKRPCLARRQNCSNARSWAPYSLSRCRAHLGSRYTSHTASQVAKVTVIASVCGLINEAHQTAAYFLASISFYSTFVSLALSSERRSGCMLKRSIKHLYAPFTPDSQTEVPLPQLAVQLPGAEKLSCDGCMCSGEGCMRSSQLLHALGRLMPSLGLCTIGSACSRVFWDGWHVRQKGSEEVLGGGGRQLGLLGWAAGRCAYV